MCREILPDDQLDCESGKYEGETGRQRKYGDDGRSFDWSVTEER